MQKQTGLLQLLGLPLYPPSKPSLIPSRRCWDRNRSSCLDKPHQANGVPPMWKRLIGMTETRVGVADRGEIRGQEGLWVSQREVG